MPKQIVRVTEERTDTTSPTELTARFAAIRAELKVPGDFPADVVAEAEQVLAHPLETVDRDETAVPFLTIDPPGSMDLDQAMHLERAGDGYRVRYAITCLPVFVAPGGAIDTEARRRGQTIYSPDERTPLHPTVLSEGAASLLPGQVCAAYVWDLRLDATGEGTAVEVHRARVRSVDRFDYAQVQSAVDGGTTDERLVLLKEVGVKRIAREAARGGANLPIPDQEVDKQDDGTYALHFRPPVPSEEWNAQISLMTGMAAAELMTGAEVGILRTMPAPDQGALNRFRHQARALGIDWPEGERYGDLLRRLDRTNPKHLALIYDATSLFRGASYTAFDGSVPEHPGHAAVASTYAHVTAPLRRLVDRFGLAVCEAISAGQPVPQWAREALPSLPDIMATSDRLAGAVNRACTDAAEAAVLAHRVGEDFPAVVVDRNEKGAHIQLIDPAVVASAQGPGAAGDAVTARLTKAEIATGTVQFQLQH